MKTRSGMPHVWRVDDPKVGVSHWATRLDAERVVRHRPGAGGISITRVRARPGDTISQLGRADVRIPRTRAILSPRTRF